MKNKLKSLYIFEGFEDSFLNKILLSSEIKNFGKGLEIIKEGSKSDNAYVLIKGIVSVNIKGKNINTIFEGDIFGEIGLVLDEVRTATIKTETEVTVLIINKNTIFKVLSKEPEGDYIKITILNRIIQNNKHLKKYE